MRKDKGFEVLDKITLYVSGNSKIEDVVRKFEDTIKAETLTLEVIYGDETHTGYTEVNINGEALNLDTEVVK